MKKSGAALGCAVVSIAVHAQPPAAPVLVPAVATQPAAVMMPVAAPSQAMLKSGTPITLRLTEQLTTRNKKSRVGSRFNLEVADPVTVGGMTVIPSGSLATGEVTATKGNGMWGKAGRLNARLVSVRANDRTIRLTGSFDDKGKSGTAGVVASVVFVPVAGFFVKGRSADIPAGTTVSGYIDEDVPLAFAAAPVAPMAIAAPAPMPVAAPAAQPVAAVAVVASPAVVAAPAPVMAAPAAVVQAVPTEEPAAPVAGKKRRKR